MAVADPGSRQPQEAKTPLLDSPVAGVNFSFALMFHSPRAN
jgi:hypothetical protein